MRPLRYFHGAVLIPALIILSGCHYPAAIKSASTQMKVQTADLTKLYANDLSALRDRLDEAGKALDATRDELASARASQKALADRLVATHYALQMSRAMQQFDLGALNLLSRDFDDAFHKVYMGKLQPKVDELKNQRAAAEKAYQADRGNNALLKEYAVATGRLQAVQTACMEDYRLLYLEFVTRVVQTRQEVVNRISTNAPPGALLDAGAAPDYQALLHPKEVAAPPALPDLAQGIAQREKDLAAYAVALNGLEVEIDQFLQTDGNRKEIIAAFASGFFGGAQDTIKKLLGMAETSTTGWLQEKVGVPDAAKYTQPLFSSISQAVTQGLDQLKGNLPDQIDKIAMKAESQVTQAVTSNK